MKPPSPERPLNCRSSPVPRCRNLTSQDDGRQKQTAVARPPTHLIQADPDQQHQREVERALGDAYQLDQRMQRLRLSGNASRTRTWFRVKSTVGGITIYTDTGLRKIDGHKVTLTIQSHEGSTTMLVLTRRSTVPSYTNPLLSSSGWKVEPW